MNKLTHCPLCKGSDTKRTLRIDPRCIDKLYQKQLSMHVLPYFKGEQYIYETYCSTCHLRFFSPTTIPDSEYYSKLEQFPWYYSDSKWEYIYAAKLIPAKSTVLDIGCGEGKFQNHIPTCTFVGIEFNKQAVEKGKAQGRTIYNESIHTFSEKHKNTYDVICLFQVLEHISDIQEFIISTVRALKKGGMLIIAVPNNRSFMGQLINNMMNLPPHHTGLWDVDSLSYLETYGLKVKHIAYEPLGSHADSFFLAKLEHFVFSTILRLQLRAVCNPAYLFTAYLIRKVSRVLSFFFKKYIRAIDHTILVAYTKN